MPAEFKWNRLLINAGGEGEFVASFEANIEALMEREYEEIECDLSRCIGLADRAVALIQWAMVLFAASDKHVTLRLPSMLESYLQTTPVPSNVVIEWVRPSFGRAKQVEVMVEDTAVRQRSDESDRRRRTSRQIPRSEASYEESLDAESASESSEPVDASEPQAPENWPKEWPEESAEVREATLRSQTGSEIRADTSDLLQVSKQKATGRKAKPAAAKRVADGSEPPVAEELTIHKVRRDDSKATDRRPQTEDADEAKTSHQRTQRGWKTSRWVDLGGARAFLRLDGQDHPRELGQEILIGREPSSDWIVDEPTVSKRHFRIFILRNRWHLQDMDSTNGTYLNFLELKGPPVPISDGDVIALAVNENAPEGTVRFHFSITEEEGV